MNGIITNSETGEIIGTVDIKPPNPKYIIQWCYRHDYKRWRNVRKAQRLTNPRQCDLPILLNIKN